MNHESTFCDRNFHSLFSLGTKTSPSIREKKKTDEKFWEHLAYGLIQLYYLAVLPDFEMSYFESSHARFHLPSGDTGETSPSCELPLAWSHGYRRKQD